MPKLIPLSSKRMKEMGIVRSKNGYLMRTVKENKPENNKLSPKPQPKSHPKPERYIQDKAPRQHKEPSRQSETKRQEVKRLEDRGIY